jgi:hypothetical protein
MGDRNMLHEFEGADAPSTTDANPGPSRRQVVRIGANLAWAVPAVSLATAVPALAASGKGKLQLSSFSAAASTTKVTMKVGAVSNPGPGDAGIPTATLSLSPKPKGITKVTGSSGWKQSGGKTGLKFTSTKGKLLKGGKTSALTVTVTYKKAKKAPKGTARVVVVASNSTPASVTKSDKF